MQIYQVKQKIPFQVLFLEFLAVFVDERTTGVDYLEVCNVTEKQKKIKMNIDGQIPASFKQGFLFNVCNV